MKLLSIFLLAACLQVSANGFGQTISLSEHNRPLEKVLKKIEQQSGFHFFYKNEVLEKGKRVTIAVNNVPLEDALRLCFKDQPLSYKIVDNTVVITEKRETPKEPNAGAGLQPVPPLITIKGRITDESGEPLLATITVRALKTPPPPTPTATTPFPTSMKTPPSLSPALASMLPLKLKWPAALPSITQPQEK